MKIKSFESNGTQVIEQKQRGLLTDICKTNEKGHERSLQVFQLSFFKWKSTKSSWLVSIIHSMASKSEKEIALPTIVL